MYTQVKETSQNTREHTDSVLHAFMIAVSNGQAFFYHQTAVNTAES
jgi:succinylarginine dihydrolase